MEAGTTHTEPGFDDYAITASYHTTAKPGKRAQPGPRPSNGGKVPRAVIKCAFCDGGYRSSDCAIYTDADSRLKVVKEKRLYFNCFAKHPVAKCSSSNRCLKCKQKHHTTICSSQAGNQSSSTSSNETMTSETAYYIQIQTCQTRKFY